MEKVQIKNKTINFRKEGEQLSDLWCESFLGHVDVKKLKQKAISLKQELDTLHTDFRGFFGWGQTIILGNRLHSQLKQLLDEIDYQEGRLQIEKRPYSKPSARIMPHGCKKSDMCECGCWALKRKEYFKL